MNSFSEIDAFVRIARAGSISGAARQLNIAKSAASKRLSDLEARLGVQLFIRTTRKLTLTDAGARFLTRAIQLLDDLEEAEAEASASQHQLKGKLKLAAPLSFGIIHLQPVLSRFSQLHDQLDLEVDLADRVVDIVEEGFDAAIRIGVLADSSLIAKRLCPIRSRLVAAPSFWDKHGRPRRPEDLTTLPCLRYSNLARFDVIDYWGNKGERGKIAPPIKVLANNGEFLTNMAIDGHGFLAEPTFFLHEHIRTGALEPVLDDYVWSAMELYVLYPPTRQLSARVRAFVDFMAAQFHNNPYWDERL